MTFDDLVYKYRHLGKIIMHTGRCDFTICILYNNVWNYIAYSEVNKGMSFDEIENQVIMIADNILSNWSDNNDIY